MKVIAQPETYSDILERLFITTLITGVVCTGLLANASPDVKVILDSITMQAQLGPVKGLNLLYVAIPALFALFSRIIKLHDKVSDLLGLRRVIDTQWILLPLAAGIGLHLDAAELRQLKQARRDAMYRVFYPYGAITESCVRT